MGSRLSLHNVFCTILGSTNAYYQPPENLKLKYPAIIYSLKPIDIKYADDEKYLRHNCYSVTLVDKNPESLYFEPLLKLKYCTFNSSFASEGLNHFIFTLFY